MLKSGRQEEKEKPSPAKRETVLESIPEASDESSDESSEESDSNTKSNTEDLPTEYTGLELEERDQLRAAMGGAKEPSDKLTRVGSSNKLNSNSVDSSTKKRSTPSTGNDTALDELKATKADDARVRVEEWDCELGKVMGVGEGEVLTQAAEVIRVFCLRWWRRRVTRSFFCWLHQKPEY